jgi:hypothetical protein
MTPIELHNEYRKGRRDRFRAMSKQELSEAPCRSCGCLGNQRCGHLPLAAPEHHCELDYESMTCFCCKTAKRMKCC